VRYVAICTVIVVEGILDTGMTLQYLLRVFEQRKPKRIRVAVLLDKPERRIAAVHQQLRSPYGCRPVVPHDGALWISGFDYLILFANVEAVNRARCVPSGAARASSEQVTLDPRVPFLAKDLPLIIPRRN